jgi:hypothetical protein
MVIVSHAPFLDRSAAIRHGEICRFIIPSDSLNGWERSFSDFNRSRNHRVLRPFKYVWLFHLFASARRSGADRRLMVCYGQFHMNGSWRLEMCTEIEKGSRTIQFLVFRCVIYPQMMRCNLITVEISASRVVLMSKFLSISMLCLIFRRASVNLAARSRVQSR